MKIACVGGGPAGLYFAVLAKQADPAYEIAVYERNRADDTFGFGVVFSDNTMGFLTEQDRASYPEITAASMHWDPITFIHQARTLRCRGVGFSAIERKKLLNILQRQATALGVELHFQAELADLSAFADCDLVVASDGVNSTVRPLLAEHFRPHIELGPTRFTWLGTTRRFDSLTFFFEESEHGRFGAHIYPYGERSTFIVETDEETWQRAGISGFSEADTIAYCERLFARQLAGERLLSNRSLWFQFRTVHNARWHHENVVLIGDAAHTAHFSVGSGTKMAMEDALALSQALRRTRGVPDALVAFEEERRPRVEHIQRMAASSFDWWATFRYYVDFPPEKLAFHCLTRSLFRYDTLRDRDPAFLGAVEVTADVDVEQRVIGLQPPGDSGAVLLRLAGELPGVLTQPVAISSDGRISPEDEGLFEGDQEGRWKDLVSRLHERNGARVGVQLGHAGARGATRPRREGLDRPLASGSWPLLAASAIPYTSRSQVPQEATAADMMRVREDFARAAARAAGCGFDFLQLNFGHGYFLASFISPLTNRRLDAYGGSLAKRLRYPLEVLDGVRAVWPADRMLTVAFSATDWEPGGTSDEDAKQIAVWFREHGSDFVTVVGGQTSTRAGAPYGRCFQMRVAGKIRNEAGVPVIASGGMTDLDDARTVLLSGRADYCLLDHARLGAPSC
jgi:anthraniloyl-CoA monooxygenase